MSVSQLSVCDVCGHSVETPKNNTEQRRPVFGFGFFENVGAPADSLAYKTYDLCAKCSREVAAFVETMRKD